MPTKRRPVERGRRAPPIDPEWWALLHDEPIPKDGNPFAEFTFDAEAPRLWGEYRERILAEWIRDKPGTRPSLWWRFDAPRLLDIPRAHRHCYSTPDLIEPRRLLSGAGRPACEVLNIVPAYSLGIPVDWSGFDPVEPPRFESQYEYLQRYGLLERGEGPSEVEPEVELHTYWSDGAKGG
jgi:hypothetical protein